MSPRSVATALPALVIVGGIIVASQLAGLFGSFQTIRLVHFLCMSAIVAFILVHVTLALLVPQSLVAMLTGGPVVDDGAPRRGGAPGIEATQ